MSRWYERPEIVSYVADAYVGVEENTATGLPRRVFLWEDGAQTYAGNVEAFLIHLVRRFGLNVTTAQTTCIHRLLRALGETVGERPHAPPTPSAGPAQPRPEPEQWAV